MRLTNSLRDATESVTVATSALSETVPDIRRTAMAATEAFTLISYVAIAALLMATAALLLADSRG